MTTKRKQRESKRRKLYDYEGAAVTRSYDYGRKSNCDGYHFMTTEAKEGKILLMDHCYFTHDGYHYSYGTLRNYRDSI